MTWLLRAGVGLARRDAGQLQVGTDPPQAVVLPDRPPVRRLLAELAQGAPLSALDATTTPALEALAAAGLVVPAESDAARRGLRAACRVHVDAPEDVRPTILHALSEAGLRCTRRAAGAAVALLWSGGEPGRERLDEWMRSGTAHLLVRELPSGPLLGPYVVPGATACLRCVDARFAERDPRRALVLEQLAAAPPLRAAEPDETQRALALAWAVCDLATAAEGRRPSTWSATVSLGSLPAAVTTYERHLHCGCAWAEDLVDRAAARAAGGAGGLPVAEAS